MRPTLASLLLLATVATGQPGPSEAAVEFLGTLDGEGIELDQATAIAPQATEEKRRSICLRLERLADELEEGDLRAVDEKVDGELAAVLVSQIVDFDPNRVTVHAVALRKLDDRWLPTPVPASFENTGLTYLPELSRRAAALEDWLLHERASQTQRLRENILGDLLADIGAAMSRDELHESTPETLAFLFIEACRQRDLPRALACLGGLEDPLPGSWNDTLKLTARAFRSPGEAPGAWERLLSPTAVRTALSAELDAEGASVRIGEIEPAGERPGRPEVAILDFAFDRGAGGLWRLALPLWLLEDPQPGFATVDPTDPDALTVPARLLETHPPRRFETAAALGESFRRALGDASFAPLLEHLARPENDPLESIGLLARLWNGFLVRPAVFPMVLDATEHEDRGRLLLTDFDARSPEIAALVIPVDLVRRDGGWQVAPWVDDLRGEPDFDPWLNEWSGDALKLDAAGWLGRLGLHAAIGGLTADSAPGEDEARRAVEAWLEATRNCDPRASLTAGAAFDDPVGGERLLKAVGRCFQPTETREILAIHRKGRWAAASVRHHHESAELEPFDLLHPVVATADGPRVLGEAMLETADNRSRKYLNERIWKRLGDRLPQAAVDELRELAKAHAELSESR